MFSNAQIDLDTLPSIGDVDLKPISKDYLKIIIINRLVFYSVIIIALFVAKSILPYGQFHEVFWYILTACGLVFLFNFSIAILAFKKRKYAIRERDVIYSKGLVVNSISAVPISRIQHIEISRTWLDRSFNLATLKIFTAGESGIDLRIEGLDHNEAKKINDFLSKRVNGTD